MEVWAEKELRNLKIMQSHGINVPIPVLHRDNILLMTFVGKSGFPSPCLKDIKGDSNMDMYYLDVIRIMR